MQDTNKKLDSVIDQRKQDMGELHLKLQKVQESVASTKDWTAQKVIFVLESIYLLGTGMHAALLNLMMSERRGDGRAGFGGK